MVPIWGKRSDVKDDSEASECTRERDNFQRLQSNGTIWVSQRADVEVDLYLLSMFKQTCLKINVTGYPLKFTGNGFIILKTS